MNPCDKCKRPMDLKCCHNCKKDAAECNVWHKCGEDCKEWEETIQTNADRIRAMSEEELAKFLMKAHDCELHIPFCTNKPECADDLDQGCIPEERCLKCMMDWLNAEVDNG